jgi:hypothetical protein
MSATVCLVANCIGYPEGGGHLWVYLNWALGLRALGCRLVWMERVGGPGGIRPEQAPGHLAALKKRLERYDLAETVALCSWSGEPLSPEVLAGCIDLDAAVEADLLLNFVYTLPDAVVGRFRRSALMDIDPGLLQVWIAQGYVHLAQYHVHFTTGETVGRPGARFPDVGLPWHHVPPYVALDAWPVTPAAAEAPFTTVSHWYAQEWVNDDGEGYANDKRCGFLPFLDLPLHTKQPLELALCFGEGDEDERENLLRRGWRICESGEVSFTPWDYQHYIQSSRGEFSCAKPSTVRMQNAWVSDRTLCYLASGKPAVVQHTGPSWCLPDAAGLFRFHTLEEAARHLDTVAADYEHQSRLARALVKRYFDARKVAAKVLEHAL